MNVFLTILLIICSLTIGVILLLILLFYIVKDKKIIVLTNEELPTASILVAARNEEKTIQKCIQHLINLDYPVEKLQILIGDDDSNDKTHTIARELAQCHDHITLIKIKPGITKGKSNVLAQLEKMATGEYVLITDADTFVPASWAKTMVSVCDNSIGIVSGITIPTSNNGIFERLQSIDWLYAQGMVKSLEKLGKSTVAMGNNMLIKHNAYTQTGGYEQLPFSITEDVQLHQEVLKLGWKAKNVFDTSVLALTTPIDTIAQLSMQRKRWIHGALTLPFPILSLLLIQAFYYPSILLMIWINPTLSIIFVCTKSFAQLIYLKLLSKQLEINERVTLISIVLHELFLFYFSIHQMIHWLTPSKITWKNRTY